MPSHAFRFALGVGTLLLAACAGDTAEPNGLSAPAAQLLEPPNPPIIRLHYDYMVASDHSHAPKSATFDTLVAVFRRHGITLVVDPLHTAIPESRFLVFDGDHVDCPLFGGDMTAANFYQLKAQYFQPHGSQPWHYAIFAHAGDPTGHKSGCFNSGFSILGGYDFVVTLPFFEPVAFPGWTPELIREWLPKLETGSTLHELGHNLCLHHGGGCSSAFPLGDPVNYKPNYVSVMNYLFGSGIPYSAVTGSVAEVGRRFDYSDQELPALDEAHLDERLGVQAGTKDIVSYLCLPPGHADPEAHLGPASGPIDWNCDGVIEPGVAQDLDVALECPASFPCYSILTGFDDWTEVLAWIRAPAYLAGLLRSRGLVP